MNRSNLTGRYLSSQPWKPLLNTTLIITIGIQSIGLHITNTTQQAEINYLKAYSKHIETKGLEHWNNLNTLQSNRFEKPDNIEEVIQYVFNEDAPTMLKVAQCESGLNPKAKNKQSSARGLFQVLSHTHQVQEQFLYDPFINTLIAKKLHDASGLNPWNASRHCWSK